MTPQQLDLILDAVGLVLGEQRVIVIGSQAVLASLDTPPAETVVSIEADIIPLDDPDGRKADLIDGAIGELSEFQNRWGVYAQGVGMRTAKLPAGWLDRLVPRTSPRGTVGLCLEIHDLAVSKLCAGRQRDFPFVEALIAAGAVDVPTAVQRLATVTDVHEAVRQQAATWLHARSSP